MSNAAKLLGQELRVAQRGCRREPRRSLSMSLELASSVSFLSRLFFRARTVQSYHRLSLVQIAMTRGRFTTFFCHSSVPTLPMKLEVAIEAKAASVVA